MSHKSTPSASECPSFTRTSVSVDEAVAMLLGWITGPVELRSNSEDPSEEEEAVIDAYFFDLSERIHDVRERIEADLSWAESEGPQSEAERLRGELNRLKETEARAFTYRCAIEDELNKREASALRKDLSLSNKSLPYITLASFAQWASNKYGISILSPVASSKIEPELQAPQPAREQPWLIARPDDPSPEQPWYVAARYFAREIVKEEPALVLKRELLASRVAKALDNVGIYKRGGIKPPATGTIRKAFSNINFG